MPNATTLLCEIEARRRCRAAQTMLRAEDICSWPAAAVSPTARTGDAERLANDQQIHHLLVLRADALAGIVCTCDLRDVPAHAPIGRYMTQPVVTERPDAMLSEAAEHMDQHGVDALPIAWRGAWGILTRGDLARYGVSRRRSCAVCGERHHVRREPRTEPRTEAAWLCRDCLDVRQVSDPIDCLYVDIGVVD